MPQMRKLQHWKKSTIEELESIKIEGAKMLLDLTKDSTKKELDLADLEHKERVKEIETKFKDEADLKARLLKQESEYYEKTRTDITREGNQKQLSEQEQLEISSLEIMSFYGAKTEEAEEQKQLAILFLYHFERVAYVSFPSASAIFIWLSQPSKRCFFCSIK